MLITWVFSAAGMGLLLVPLQRWPRMAASLVALTSMIGAVQLEMLSRFGGGVDVNALNLLAETNVDEALPLIHSIPTRLWVAFSAIGTVWTVMMIRPLRVGSWPARKLAGYSVFIMACCVALAALSDGGWKNPAGPSGFGTHLGDGYEALRKSIPTGLPMVVYGYYEERAALETAAAQLAGFSFGARRKDPAGAGRRVHVLVIGETSRADHWQINGYGRETSPLLAKRKDLVSYSQFYSPLTYTRLSVPVILSRRPSNWTEPVYLERSLIWAAREAGYKTVWLSNQGALGFHDSPVTLLAKDAEDVRFVSPVEYRSAGIRDEELIPHVDDVLEQYPDDDVFMVIHTLGSHFRYTDRYLPSDAHFLPDRPVSGDARLYEPGHREFLVNAYDNSLRGTDRFLSALIDRLQGENALSWLFYVADHGEALFDDCRGESGHGQSSRATHHVAAMWWGNDAWRRSYVDKTDWMMRNKDSLLSTTVVFDSVLSLAAVKLPGATRAGFDLSKGPVFPPKEISELNLGAARCE